MIASRKFCYTINLTAEVMQVVDSYCRRSKKSRSALIRAALQEYMAARGFNLPADVEPTWNTRIPEKPCTERGSVA